MSDASADDVRRMGLNREAYILTLEAQLRQLTEVLNDTIKLVEGLADQQAWYDGWFEPGLEAARRVAAGGAHG